MSAGDCICTAASLSGSTSELSTTRRVQGGSGRCSPTGRACMQSHRTEQELDLGDERELKNGSPTSEVCGQSKVRGECWACSETIAQSRPIRRRTGP
jgi:hypothetical protein